MQRYRSLRPFNFLHYYFTIYLLIFSFTHNLELRDFHKKISVMEYLPRQDSGKCKIMEGLFTLEISSLDMGHHTTQAFMLIG